MQNWKTSKIYFWEEAPFFRLLLSLIAAIICYEFHFLPQLNHFALLIILIVLSFFTTSFSFLKNTNKVFSGIQSALIFTNLFFLGWFMCYAFDIQNDTSWFGNKLSNSDFFEATILKNPTEKDRTWKLEVTVNKAIHENKIVSTKGIANVYIYKKEQKLDLQESDKILLPNKWIAIKNSGNPFEFDYARFARRENIFYQEFLSTNDFTKINTATESPSYLDKWHDWSMEKLAFYVKDKNAIGLLQAMLLGDKLNFDEDQRQLYVETGIIHIVAISGGHVAFLFLIISSCFFWIKNEKHKWMKYIIALPFVWIYVLMAGAPPSAIRAATMFSFISLGFIFQKNSNPLNQLFAAAFIILLSKPFWLFAVGFQLSFLAVLSLIIFYKRVENIWRPQNIIVRKIWSVVAASISAELLIAPLVIYYFHIFPIAFIFSNIIAWMVMGIVMIAGILIIGCSGFPVFAFLIAFFVSKLVAVFNFLLSELQLLNPPTFKLLYLSSWQLILVYIFLISASIFMIQKQKSSLLISISTIAILLISFGLSRWHYLQQRQFVAYNINHTSYAEFLEGNKFSVVLDDSLVDSQTKKYSSKEMHIVLHALHQTENKFGNIFQIGKEKLLILKEPIGIDTITNLKVDYLLINYPLKDFYVKELQTIFHFKKLIIPSNQKRYIAERWRDSCNKYNVAAHFTLFDGAFILSE